MQVQDFDIKITFKNILANNMRLNSITLSIFYVLM